MLQVAHFHIGHGTRHRQFLLRTHSRYDHLVNGIELLLVQGNVHSGLAALHHLLYSLIANI